MADRRVLVIGGGVAGMAVAGGLTRHGVAVDMVEKAPFLGGHASGFTCKATDACVQCGACMVETLLTAVNAAPRLDVFCSARLDAVAREAARFTVTVDHAPVFIDPQRCNGCGLCLDACPRAGALAAAPSALHRPFVALTPDRCRYFKDRGCTRCRDVCPKNAFALDASPRRTVRPVDAVVVAAGFAPFDPAGHVCAPPPRPVPIVDNRRHAGGGFAVWQYPVGGRQSNVLTHLALEARLRRGGPVTRCSDGAIAEKVAFVLCVGSRDAALGHLWCSRVCCASALRMAALIRHRRPETEITVFYIDIQTFGKDFDDAYNRACAQFSMVRTMPAEIRVTGDDRLRVSYFDKPADQSLEADFDLLVLAVGMIPGPDTARLSALLGAATAETGFFPDRAKMAGVFCAGSAKGPMGIADAVADADRTVWDVVQYLREAP